MAGLFSLDDVKNRPHRSSFDLQAKRAFTAKAGELLPVDWTFTMPGDRFRLKNTWFTRTRPVQTSAYTRMREYYDYFFVPLRQLWKQAPQSVMQMTDNSTAAASSTEAASVGTLFPSLSLSELYAALTSTSSSPTFVDSLNLLGYRRGDLAVKLLRYLGYGNFFQHGYEKNYGTTNPVSDYDQAYGANVSVNLFPLMAYQKIYNDFFRNTQWEKSKPYTYNADYWTGRGSFATALKNQLLNHSLLGRTMLDIGYCNWNKDLFMGVRPTSQYGDVAIVNVSSFDIDSSETVNLSSSVFNLTGGASFQKSTFVDGFSSLPSLVGKLTGQDAVSPAYPFRGAPSDAQREVYYVGPSDPSSINTFDLNSPLRVDLSTSQPGVSIKSPVRSGSSSIDGSINITDARLEREGAAIVSDFSILALRQAEALQKWKEITLSGDQSYRDQVYKHFGVSLPAEMSDLVRYLGGTSGNLDISEVVNTTLPAGELASGYEANIKGKGVGVGDGDTITFEAKEHGVLMCIYHCVPILDYDLSGQDPQLLLTSAEDMPIPEFDNLGMQELPLTTLYNRYSEGSEDELSYRYVGYVPRYVAFKTKYDRVMGAFSTTLRDWVAPVNDQFLMPFFTLDPKDSPFPLNYGFFKVNPAILNNIFGLAVDDTWDTDQFLVNCQFDTRVVRNLSVTGMPY